MGSFNNWDIIKFANKTTRNKDIFEVHKVVLDGIGDNMSRIVQNGTYGAINTTDPTTIGYYVVNLSSEPYTLEYDNRVDNQVINADEIIVKS